MVFKRITECIADSMDDHPKVWTFGAILTAGGIVFGGLYYDFGGETRRTMNPNGKTLEYKLPEDFNKMISVSSGGSEGDMMITYEDKKGNLLTKEYNRQRLFETTIKWSYVTPERK